MKMTGFSRRTILFFISITILLMLSSCTENREEIERIHLDDAITSIALLFPEIDIYEIMVGRQYCEIIEIGDFICPSEWWERFNER